MMYFVIYNSDGDTHVTVLDKDTLEEQLNAHYWGDNVLFLDAIPTSDTNYWPEDAVLIIKGNIIVPHAQQVIMRHVVE